MKARAQLASVDGNSRKLQPRFKWLFAAALFAAMLIATPIGAANQPGTRAVDGDTMPDRVAIENLQRWVNGGHDTWCRIPQMVASAELRRISSEYPGDQIELTEVPAGNGAANPNRIVYTWTTLDGSTTYRVAVERYSWLLPIAGKTESIIWVPAHVEILVHSAPDDGPHSHA